MYSIKEKTCNIVGTFGATRCFGTRGIVPSLPPSLNPGSTLRNKVRSCEIRRAVNVEPLLRIERSQLRCNENNGQRIRCKRHFCRRLDNSCYHHQFIYNWTAVILLQVFIVSQEKTCSRSLQFNCKWTDDGNRSYWNVCKNVVYIVSFGRYFHYKAIQHFYFSCTNSYVGSAMCLECPRKTGEAGPAG